jgi:TorA maturation chaperone TorD
MEAASVVIHHRLEPEDQARADFYALLARLYAQAPDAALLRAIAQAPALAPVSLVEVDTSAAAVRLAAAWDALRAASLAMDAEAAKLEFDTLFYGVGESPVNLHASHWLTGFMMERPLAELRRVLAQMGLGREPTATLVEDHLSSLCEVMRTLIAGRDGARPFPIEEQRAFFERYIAPWASSCCAALSSNSVANYYRRVGEFTEAFLALERDSIAMDT